MLFIHMYKVIHLWFEQTLKIDIKKNGDQIIKDLIPAI